MNSTADDNLVLLNEVRRIRELVDPSSQTVPKKFEEACEEFLAEQLLVTRNHRSAQSLIRIIRRHFDGRLLHEITLHDLQVWVQRRLSAGVGGATINRQRAVLSRLFNWAIDRGYAGVNPVRRLKKFRESPGRTRFLSEEEVSRLHIEAARHLRPILMAAVYTGGRLRELLSLRWRDVDESAGIVVFRRETTKSGRERIVPLREELLGALRTLKRGGPEDRVFNYRGTGLTTIRTAFENARDKAGLPDVHFHDLRHTFASGYVQRGGDIYRLQRFLGHSTPRLTERYVHLSTQFLRDGGQYIGLPKAAWEPAAEGHAGAPEKPDSAPAEKPSPSSWGDWESSSSAL